MDDALILTRLALFAVLLAAGTAKLFDRSGSQEALLDFDVPNRLVGALALLLPMAELTTAAALLAPPTARWASGAATLLFVLFIIGLVRVLRRGERPDCHCFGKVHSEPASWATVGRNAALAVPAAFLAAAGPGPSLSVWANGQTAEGLGLIAASSVAVVAMVSCCLLWRENRRLRSGAAELQPEAPRIGSRAPRFSLPSVSGSVLGPADLLAGDRPFVLTFVARECGPCTTLLPEIARWHGAVREQLGLPIVSVGDPQAAEELVREHGLDLVLADVEAATMRAYGVYGTPTAVLIGADGRVRSAPAAGAAAIEALVRMALMGESESRRAAIA